MHHFFKRVFLLLMILPLAGVAGNAQTHVAEDAFTPAPAPQGIWFRKCDTFTRRFLYSQTVLWPPTIAAHTFLILRQENFVWEYYFSWNKYRKTFTMPPVWDSDHWSWNYEVHPYMGSISYLAYRNRRASVAESVLGTALNSFIYEYIIAGGTQRPSYNDLIVTPVAGSLLGEGLYQIKKRMLRDKHLTRFEKVVLTLTDPAEVFYFGFNFRKIAANPYR